MSGDVWAGIGCLVLGGATLVNWWFEMFSDSGYGELCRDLMEEFGGGRNTIAVVEPAAGVMFLFGGGVLAPLQRIRVILPVMICRPAPIGPRIARASEQLFSWGV